MAFSLTRGHSRSHHLFSTFMFAALIGLPAFWLGGLKVINGFGDSGPPLIVEARVFRRVDKSSRLQAGVGLAGRSGTISLAVSPERYRSAKRGDLIPVLVSGGALGEPWVIGALKEKVGSAKG